MAITLTNVPRFSKLDFWNGGSPGWDTTGLRSWAWWVAAESWWPNWRTSNKSAADQTFRAMEDDQNESQSPPWSLLCHIVSSLFFWYSLGVKQHFQTHVSCLVTHTGIASSVWQKHFFKCVHFFQTETGWSRKVAALEMAFWRNSLWFWLTVRHGIDGPYL